MTVCASAGHDLLALGRRLSAVGLEVALPATARNRITMPDGLFQSCKGTALPRAMARSVTLAR